MAKNRLPGFALIVAVIIILLTLVAIRPTAENQKNQKYYIEPEFKDIIDTIWKNRKEYLINYMHSSLTNKDSQTLYVMQVYTNNLLKYAYYCGNYKILDDLAKLYLIAYYYLELKYDYIYFYLPEEHNRKTILPLNPPAWMWVDNKFDSDGDEIEMVLCSSQFLYLVSSAINLFLDIDESQRTQNMNELIERFSPIIINDHYFRWIYADQGIFQVRGWGCDDGIFNHYDFLKKIYNRSFGTMNYCSYCNAVTDTDMWIIAGVVEMLAANKKNPHLVPLADDERLRLLSYVDIGTKLLESRMSSNALIDFDGNSALGLLGLNFDLGAWDEHPENAYSGYTGELFPIESDKMAAENAGWDISHARRFVRVFETLYNNRDVTGQFFPHTRTMMCLTSQVVYGVFNKNFEKPLFSNYMDGTNGWYRVNYDDGQIIRMGFGYPPYSLSKSVISGGWGFWSKYNTDMSKLMNTLWNMLNIIWNNSDEEIVEFARKNYASQTYENYVRDTSLETLRNSFSRSDSFILLSFLSSMVIDLDYDLKKELDKDRERIKEKQNKTEQQKTKKKTING